MFAVLFPSNPLNPKEVYPDHFDKQVTAALNAGFVLGFAHDDGTITMPPGATQSVYRGWMLTGKEYAYLYMETSKAGAPLITNPKHYTHCHYLTNWINDYTGFTPFTEVFPIPHGSDESQELVVGYIIDQMSTHWALTGAVIVKDYVKSQSAMWHEACFIPSTRDKEAMRKVVETFMEWQRPLNGGLVFRDFEEIIHEYRLFVIGDVLLTNNPAVTDIPEVVRGYARKCQAPFFTLDYALTEDGTWIVIELGDGGVSDPKGISVDALYTALYLGFREV